MRRRQLARRGRRSSWSCGRSRYRAAEEDGPACQVRDDGTDPRGDRQLPRCRQEKARRISLRRSSQGRSTYHDATVCPPGRPMDRRHRSGPEVLWDALTAPNQSDPHLPPDWQPAGSSAFVRSHGILPANTRRKPRSTTLTIRNSVRLSSSEGVSSRTTTKWRSSCSPTALLPSCQRGCSPNRLHNTEYVDPQRFQLHFCSLCVSKSMRS